MIVSVTGVSEAIPSVYVGQRDICRGMSVQGEQGQGHAGKASGRLGVGGGGEVPRGSVTLRQEALNPRAVAGVRSVRCDWAHFPQVTW